MTWLRLFIFCMHLLGMREHSALREHVTAILAATGDPEEARLLAVVAFRETRFDADSTEVYFGRSYYEHARRTAHMRRCARLHDRARWLACVRAYVPTPIGEAAQSALRILREHRAYCGARVERAARRGIAFTVMQAREARRRIAAHELLEPRPGGPIVIPAGTLDDGTIEGRWGLALSRYHRGHAGALSGCHMVHLAWVEVLDMMGVAPLDLPPTARLLGSLP